MNIPQEAYGFTEADEMAGPDRGRFPTWRAAEAHARAQGNTPESIGYVAFDNYVESLVGVAS